MEESKGTGFTSKKFAGSQFVFNRIRGKIRETSTKGDTLFSLFRSKDPSEYGKLTLKIFLFTLATVGVKLDDEEVECILKYYTNFKGEVDYLKFYKSLDMSVPEGYLNPEYFFDALPQPYRLISKILEFEILDKAWLDIVRRHPEVQVDSDGEQLVRLRNQNLNLSCLPTFTIEQHVLVKDVSNSRTNSNVYMVNSVGLLTVLDLHNGKNKCTLNVFSGRNDALISICGVSNKNGNRDVDVLAMSCLFVASESGNDGDINKNNTAQKRIVPNETLPDAATTLGSDNSDKEISLRLDLVVVEVQGHTANIVFSTSLDGYKCSSSSIPNISVSLSDDGLTLSALKGTTLCLYSLFNSDALDVPELDQLGRKMGNIAEEAEITEFVDIDQPKIAKDPTCVIDLSTYFAQVSSLSEGTSEPAITISAPTTAAATTHPPAKSGNKTASNTNTQAAATAAAANSITSKSVPKIIPPEIKSLFLFPLSPSNSYDKKINKDKLKLYENLSAEKRFLLYLLDFGIAILWEGISEWLVLGIQDDAAAAVPSAGANITTKPGEDSAGVPSAKDKQLLKGSSFKNKVNEVGSNPANKSSATTTTAANAKNNAHQGTTNGLIKPNNLTSEFPSSILVVTYESARWQLSSEVTAYCIDEDRSLLGLGLCDGSVSLWDLRSLVLCGGAFGRHETAVKSLSIIQGKGLSMVSGAIDGSLCFFSISAGIPSLGVYDTTDNTTNKALDQSTLSTVLRELKAARSSKYQWGVLTVKLLNFRHDVCCPILQINRIPRTSFFVALTAEGEYVLYDCDGIELLGVIKPKAILPGMKPTWRPLCQAHIASCFQPLPMSTQPPSVATIATAITSAATLPTVQATNSKTLVAIPTDTTASAVALEDSLPLTLKPFVCTEPLLDYPYKWTETRRPPGFFCAPKEAIDILKPLKPFCAVTAAGFLSLFRFSEPDVDKADASSSTPQTTGLKPVMIGIFTLDHMLKSFCPGIAALNKQLLQELRKGRSHDHIHDVASPKSLFTLLTITQRMDPNITVSQVETLKAFLSNPPTQEKIDKKTTKSPPKDKQSTVSRGSSFRSTSDNTKHRRGSLLRADSGLTEKKLLALHSSYNPQLAVVEDLRFHSLMHKQRPWSNVKDVTEIANNRAKMSAVMEPKSRSKIILSRLQELSNMFE